MSMSAQVLLEDKGTHVEARCSQCRHLLLKLDSPRAALFAAGSLDALLNQHNCPGRTPATELATSSNDLPVLAEKLS